MKFARTELAGTGASVAIHVGLIAALSLSLARTHNIDEAPPMQVELVDQIALDSAAPTDVPPASAPPPEAPADDVPDTVPEPDMVKPPEPKKEVAPTPKKEVPRKAEPRRERPRPRPLPRPGRDPLAADSLAPSPNLAPAAPKYDNRARASVGQLIASQVQPCADRQPYIGEGASDVAMTVRLRFTPNGRLATNPRVVDMRGDFYLREQYGQLLRDQVIRIFSECSPLNLPPELYDTPNGGWNDITINYRISS